MRKLAISLLVVGALALANTGVASAAKGGTERPWKGFSISVLSGPGEYEGWGIASHGGRNTFTQVLSSATESDVITTVANGDQIFEHFTVTEFGNGEYRYRSTITGGTGRFEGATGSATGGGVFLSVSPIKVEIWYSGTITY